MELQDCRTIIIINDEPGQTIPLSIDQPANIGLLIIRQSQFLPYTNSCLYTVQVEILPDLLFPEGKYPDGNGSVLVMPRSQEFILVPWPDRVFF